MLAMAAFHPLRVGSVSYGVYMFEKCNISYMSCHNPPETVSDPSLTFAKACDSRAVHHKHHDGHATTPWTRTCKGVRRRRSIDKDMILINPIGACHRT